MKYAAPILVGLIMGPMLLMAVHNLGASGAIWFILAHVAVLLAGALLVGFGLGRTAWGQRLAAHRPSRSHIVLMGGAMCFGAAVAHVLHAFMGHGGAI